MKRYYFDLRDGDYLAADEEGTELPDTAAVQEEAALSLAGMARDARGLVENSLFNAHFGTIAQIVEEMERFSIRMKSEHTRQYKRLGLEEEFDASIRPEWSNGFYVRLQSGK
jgi:hypothetical protein